MLISKLVVLIIQVFFSILSNFIKKSILYYKRYVILWLGIGEKKKIFEFYQLFHDEILMEREKKSCSKTFFLVDENKILASNVSFDEANTSNKLEH